MTTASTTQALLTRIRGPADLKRLGLEDLHRLAEEVREYLIEAVPRIGGHFASNLGNVELTIALHYVYDSPRDALVCDVSHGCYPHKLLTGRLDRFPTLRQDGGVSGFLSPSESEHDLALTGHAGTGLSTAMGVAWARKHSRAPGYVVAVIGDGSMPAGMSLEALNNLSVLGTGLTIVLNDNQWSIDPTAGALASVLAECRRSMSGRFFEDLGIRYRGPVDGHDLGKLIQALGEIKPLPGVNLVHVVTRKGKGYPPAEKDPLKYHALSPPEPEATGPKVPTFSSVFAATLAQLASRDERIVAVSAGMLSGTGLSEFKKVHPARCFDVGIAEEHAVTFAAGMALAGMRPVVAIYSTFLQRAYDQIVHDVCLPGLPVVFAVDRAGVAGPDGASHHGVFDLAYLRHLPGLKVLAPSSAPQLRRHLEEALRSGGPVAIRYPRGAAPQDALGSPLDPSRPVFGESRLLRRGRDAGLLAAGAMAPVALQAAEVLARRGVEVEVLEVPSVKPLDREAILDLARRLPLLVTLEDHAALGGFGGAVAELLGEERCGRLAVLGWPDRFLDHGSVENLRRRCGLHPEGIADRVQDLLRGKAAVVNGSPPVIPPPAGIPTVSPEEARGLMDGVRSLELSPALRQMQAGYEKVGHRHPFIWKWVRRGVEITSLPCVPPEVLADHCDTKSLGVVFDVLVDDVADKLAQSEFLERLISITEGGSPSRAGLSQKDRDYLEFTEEIWRQIQDRLRRYPRYAEFQELLAYDYRQLMNVMRYSVLINARPALMNMVEHDLYQPHNMHMTVSATMDLMASPGFDARELGRVREVVWFAQRMGRIGNLVTTWEREVGERDFSSGVFALALADGVLELEDLQGDPARIFQKVRGSDLEQKFLRSWKHFREEILKRAPLIRSMDVRKLVAGLDLLIRLHLGSRGLK